MARVSSLRKYDRYLVLSIMAIAFIVIAPWNGYCYTQINTTLPHVTLPPTISITPNPAYVGQTVTVKGSGWNTTPYQGDTQPLVACSIGSGIYVVQPDGTWSATTTFSGPGTVLVYAQDKWGHTSNTVNLTITDPVTFVVNVYDDANQPYTGNGVVYIKYPASGTSIKEDSLAGSTYTTKMAYNGASVEIWLTQYPITTSHKIIGSIKAGQTYTVSFNLPVSTPTPAATTVTPVPSQGTQATATASPQATVNPSATVVPDPGVPDTSAPATTLNLTGIEDASGTFTSNVVCTLTAADNGSGVNQTMYSFDGNNWIVYNGPFTISTPGNTTVFYRSEDRAGNQEVAGVKVIAIAGSASATASGQPSTGYSLLLPLLAIGLAGIYGIRKWQ